MTTVAGTRFDQRRRYTSWQTPTVQRLTTVLAQQVARRPTARHRVGQAVQTPYGVLPVRWCVYGRDGWRYGFEINAVVSVKIGGQFTGAQLPQRYAITYLEQELFPLLPTGEIPNLAAALAQWIEERHAG
jgi:hypothetical protein